MRNIKDFSTKQLVVTLLVAFALASSLALTACDGVLFPSGIQSGNQANVTNTETPSNNTVKPDANQKKYTFRNANLLKEHYNKHGKDMGFSSAAEYEAAASAVINDPRALHKFEKEDNDDVFYIKETKDFVILSTDGYIRTYFRPNSGMAYFERQ